MYDLQSILTGVCKLVTIYLHRVISQELLNYRVYVFIVAAFLTYTLVPNFFEINE